MTSSLRDLRLGLRTLTKSPALTIVCTIALMFGIGLTTMMFSIVYGAMLRGLPYPESDRIVILNRVNPARDSRQSALPIEDFDLIRREQRSFTAFGAYTSGTMNVGSDAGSGEKAERFSGSWVTANLFGMTGTRPILGRDFRAG